MSVYISLKKDFMSYRSQIKEKAKEYKSILNDIENKRAIWESKVKSLLVETFEKVKGYYKDHLDLYVSQNIDAINWQSIFLSFGKIPSGIFFPKGNGGTHMVKFGGSLGFSLTYNGDVIIDIQYPYVEKAVDQQPHKWKKVSISKINEDYIFEESLKFLNEMVQWEKSSQNAIGFNSH